jgi:Voltage gated chloride channel
VFQSRTIHVVTALSLAAGIQGRFAAVMLELALLMIMVMAAHWLRDRYREPGILGELLTGAVAGELGYWLGVPFFPFVISHGVAGLVFDHVWQGGGTVSQAAAAVLTADQLAPASRPREPPGQGPKPIPRSGAHPVGANRLQLPKDPGVPEQQHVVDAPKHAGQDLEPQEQRQRGQGCHRHIGDRQRRPTAQQPDSRRNRLEGDRRCAQAPPGRKIVCLRPEPVTSDPGDRGGVGCGACTGQGALNLELRPAATGSASAYAVVRMGATLAATTHAPLMAILMVLEMTLDYPVVLPLTLAVVTAHYRAKGHRGIRPMYAESQLPR